MANFLISPTLDPTFDCGISDVILKECKDFHQAKDGDGWVEQSSQPFFFGMLQQVSTRIYERKTSHPSNTATDLF